MGIYNSSKFNGPCWSRDRGYHTPSSLPDHIKRIITNPTKTRDVDRKEIPPTDTGE